MICPRCTVAEISETGHCALCGFSPSADVILKQSLVDEVQQVVQDSTAGRFRIEALLRLGERSLVYLAHEVAQDRLVALKVIPVFGGVTQQLAQAFERQAQLGQSLRHAHIVTLHAFGATATFLWYTMDHVREPSLGDLLRESGPLGLDRCVGIAEQVASALDYAHRRGVPHGNLKPSNIFLDERWVRVADFAILDAFGRQAPSATAGPWLRVPEYMAPEQFYARTPLAGADQYALAVVLYQCLTGTPPFIGDSFEEVARRQAREAPPPLADARPDLPVTVTQAMARALSKQPGERFPSVLDFVAALAAPPPAAGRVSGPRRTSVPRRIDPPVLTIEPEAMPRSRRWLRALLVLLALAAGAAFVLRDRLPWGEPAALPLSGPGATVSLPPASPAPAPVAGDQAAGAGATQPAAQPAAPRAGTSAPSATPSRAAAPAPAGPGTLLVNASPWGRLYIDGAYVGDTPKANISLTPGRHVVRIMREGFATFERELIVESGQTIRLTGIVLQPNGP